MTAQRVSDHQRAIAERNVDAILDAVEYLLQRREQATVSAVAAQAGVSRVTVYSHFPTSEALLEAAVERVVRRTVTALEAADPDGGSPAQALDRMLAVAWQRLASYGAMAQIVAERFDPQAVARTHHTAHQIIGALVRRGRADGSFRTDLPVSWLTASTIALVHACADEVRAGRIAETDAPAILATTVRALFGADAAGA